MSFSASLRRCAPSASRSLRQQASPPIATPSPSTRKSLKNKKRQPHTLPREKLRALVSMYHQADTFITHENLVDKINEALLKDLRKDGTFPEPPMPTPGQLRAVRDQRKDAPRMAEMTDSSANKLSTYVDYEKHWSDRSKAARERRLIEALYGVNMQGAAGARPGLEAVEAALPELEKDMAEDSSKRA